MTFGKIGARKMMWDINNLLPKGARWVEYLESEVGAFIDTKFIQSSEVLSVSIDLALPNAAFQSADYDGLFGNGIDNNTYLFCLAKQQRNAYLFWRAGGTSNLGLVTVSNTERFTANITTDGSGSYTRTIAGNTLSGTYTGSVIGAQKSCLIFGIANNVSNEIPRTSGYRCYTCKIKQNNVLVRDFAPIAIGNKGYMLDLLTGEYEQYGNKGEGEFVIGPTIAYPERERERE